MARLGVQQAGGINVLAFLDMIAYSEIGVALLTISDDGYDVLVGSTAYKPLLIRGYSQHPHILNLALNSTAAGRYQIIYPTWKNLDLSDFMPESQDIACIRLIKGRGALNLVINGDIEPAISLCAPEWASLPGAGYGQHENQMQNLITYYNVALERYT